MNAILSIKPSGDGVKIEVDNLPIFSRQEGNQWIVFSPTFKVLGYSKSNEEDAIKDLKDSLNIFFEVHAEDGTLGSALQEFGWELQILQQKKYKPSFKFPQIFNRPAETINYNTPIFA